MFLQCDVKEFIQCNVAQIDETNLTMFPTKIASDPIISLM